MHTPNFSSDLYNLWNGAEQQRTWDEVIRRTRPSHDKDDRALRSLYAPPLSAYGAEHPGPDLSHLEHTIQSTAKTSSRFHSSSSIAQQKIDQLELIRNLGHASIRPIGIERTMDEIVAEQSKSQVQEAAYEETSYNQTAENIPTDVSEVNLDANVVNADETVASPIVQAHSNLVDEGFMADDVEYQADHSVDPGLHQMLNRNQDLHDTSMVEEHDDMVIEE